MYALAFTRTGEHIAACVGAESPMRLHKSVVAVYNWREGKQVSGELGAQDGKAIGNALCVAVNSLDDRQVRTFFNWIF